MFSVIIPAHNEEAVIARTLRSLLNGAARGELEIIVVCNGCTDRTAASARAVSSDVTVVETSTSGKTHALNLGDEHAHFFPRLYVDADVNLTMDAARQLVARLQVGDVLAAAPTGRYDTKGCSWPVRAFFEVRALLPSAMEGLGGSGVYALSEAGRRRFNLFPPVLADDGFVRIQFHPQERVTLAEATTTVFPARTVRDLINTKTRAHLGSFQLADRFPNLWNNRGRGNKDALSRMVLKPEWWMKVAVYSLITLAARNRARRRLREGNMLWERDNTSRAVA